MFDLITYKIWASHCCTLFKNSTHPRVFPGLLDVFFFRLPIPHPPHHDPLLNEKPRTCAVIFHLYLLLYSLHLVKDVVFGVMQVVFGSRYARSGSD